MDSIRYRTMMGALIDRHKVDGNLRTALEAFAREADLNVDRLNHRVKTRKAAIREALPFIPEGTELHLRARVLLKKSPKAF